jgi:hypothetical protein
VTRAHLAPLLLALTLAPGGCGDAGAPAAARDGGGGAAADAPAPPDAPAADAAPADAGPDASPPAPELPEVAAWLGAHVPPPAAVTADDPLVVVVAAGTSNRIADADLHPASTSSDPVNGAPDTGGLPWWNGGDSGFQAGHLAIAALLAAGWQPCEVSSPRVRFLIWGYGSNTAGLDFYYRAPADVGTDLARVHSLGGSNMAVDGPFNGGLPAFSAVALDADAHALADALEAWAAARPHRPRVVAVAHSWGAAYASYFVHHYHALAASPSYDLVAAVLAAAPRQVLTRPLVFGLDACPPHLDEGASGLTLTCSVHTCLTGAAPGAHRAFCVLGDFAGSLRGVPAYTLERPDDPIPPADPTTVAGAIQSALGAYPGINGHDYLIRANDGWDAADAWTWDTAASATCDPGALAPVQLVTGAGASRFVGVHGIDTARVSCAIGYGTRLVYMGACTDPFRRDDGDVGVTTAPACAAPQAGAHSDVCLLGTRIDPVDGAPAPAAGDACFVTATAGGPPLLTPPAMGNRRAAAGFVGCPG